jgi:hypothetical protein
MQLARSCLASVLLAVLWAPLQAQSLTAEQIMERVAANQDKAEKQRADYIYQQRIRVATRRPNGKLLRQETTVYSVAPTSSGTEKQVKSLGGRYWHKGEYIDYQGEPRPEPDSIDGDLVEDMRDDCANEKSKDGLGRDLFPLTSDQQKNYWFKLLGERTAAGRQAYRIGFGPRDRDEITWAGEALIDKQELQPITVFTKLSRRIPFVVRTVLGTDLPGLGFNVEYRRFDDGVWFPVSFGTEFRLRAVFFINREITISLENSEFRRANVDSSIQYKRPE